MNKPLTKKKHELRMQTDECDINKTDVVYMEKDVGSALQGLKQDVPTLGEGFATSGMNMLILRLINKWFPAFKENTSKGSMPYEASVATEDRGGVNERPQLSRDEASVATKKEIQFETLGKKERELLLKALSFNKYNLKCQFCKEKVSYESCCILPALKTKRQATILCDSPLCISEYLVKDDEVRG